MSKFLIHCSMVLAELLISESVPTTLPVFVRTQTIREHNDGILTTILNSTYPKAKLLIKWCPG